ncbi:MAG: flagellar assembly peptidoglycan hydrolase FlgJ [Betaproteobacteria bacterium]|nr:flagellar assembly peptidoglycan hydrolase FlgJ [Betaproteobacteria bacterium]
MLTTSNNSLMPNNPGNTNTLAADPNGMAGLKRLAMQNSPAAIKAVSKQFEAVFLNMMLKSMREAVPQDGVLDSDQSRLYTSMLDQQLSQNMASKGIGLGDMLVQQLSRNSSAMPASTAPLPDMAEAGTPSSSAAVLPAAAEFNGTNAKHVQRFKNRLQQHAEAASRATGIPANFMLGQAALESGWGRKQIIAADGTNSHNLFGMKATAGWHGKTVSATTTEYSHGIPQKRVEKFRAYDSYAASFRDYANTLRNNPRYQHVIANAQNATEFARGLQQAGYATDPHYADKLSRIINQTFSA